MKSLGTGMYEVRDVNHHDYLSLLVVLEREGYTVWDEHEDNDKAVIKDGSRMVGEVSFSEKVSGVFIRAITYDEYLGRFLKSLKLKTIKNHNNS